MAGSRGSADNTLPRCVLCKAQGEGQTYEFWGGFFVDRKEVGSVLSSTKHVTVRYRNVRKCPAFVCEPCAARICRSAHLPGVFGWGLTAAVSLGLWIASSSGPAWVGWMFAGFFVAAGGFAAFNLFLVLKPNVSSARMDPLVLAKVKPILILRGKGDEFFTEASYRFLFKTEPGETQTAEELLESAGLDEDADDAPRPAKKKKGKRGPTKFCTFCGAELPGYAAACPECKKVLA